MVRACPIPPPTRSGDFALDDSQVIREFQEVRPARRFQLLLQRFGVHTDAHGAEFVAAACHVV